MRLASAGLRRHQRLARERTYGPRCDRPPVQIAGEIVGEMPGRFVPLCRILGECLGRDRRQIDGHRGVQPCNGAGSSSMILADNLLLIGAADRRLQGQQFIERGTERINIRAAVDDARCPDGLLRAHVMQGAWQVAGYC